MKKYSIIIPTFNRWDLLQHCLASLKIYTDLTTVEVIIVCNGCIDGTVENIKNLYPNFKYIYHPKPIGYAKAINLGLVLASGDYIILLNNDVIFLEGTWLQMLEGPFLAKSSVGITAPSLGEWGNITTAIFFCVMIKKEVFNKIGYLDPSFLVGGGEDTDFCIRATHAGFTIEIAPINSEPLQYNKDAPDMGFGTFPIYHAPCSTRSTIPEMDTIIEKNHQLLIQRWGPA